MADMIVGYGSLIDPNQREKAGLSRAGDIVRLRGYRRRWNVKTSNKKTYLGVVPSPTGSLNAVLFPVDGRQLSLLDEREGAYDRLEVEAGVLDMPPGARAWLYVPKAEWIRDDASPDFAVKRSYVDAVIAGCLAYGEGFCREFIATTDLWEQYWYDNRKAPQELQARIDALVGAYYPATRQVLDPLPPRRHPPTT